MLGRSELPSHFPGISSRWDISSTLSWRVKWRNSNIGSFWSYPLFVCSISHFATCYVFLYCAALYWWAMTFSVCKYIDKEVDTRIRQAYQFRESCIKPNQILMSWSLLCMCCKEQLPLLFIVQKNKLWSCISVEDLGQIVCDGLHVLGLYVFIYAIYIPQTDFLDMGRKKCWNFSCKMVHYAMPWLWRER